MASKETLTCDTECYRDYWLIGFRNAATGNVRQFEAVGETGKLDLGQMGSISSIFHRYRIVTFNGNRYDIPIITAALKGATCADLKAISDKIIQNNIQTWNLGIGDMIRCDHIDLFEVAPGMASLKIYGGRLHCRKMQDLPIHEAASIAPEDRPLLRQYNGNDLETTQALFEHLLPQIELREQMSATYGLDLRSKSDAQIAEAVIAKEVSAALGGTLQKPEVKPGTRFHYRPPKFIRFETQALIDAFGLVQRAEFLIPDGNMQMPDELKKAVIKVGDSTYKIGIGGLHSQEKTVTYLADDDHILVDRDVTGYYPAIIVNNNISPPHTGSMFMKSFRAKKDQRVVAKKAGDKTVADTLKIVLNGLGGKLNSKWSKFYYPQGFIHMTLTGQLSILMLIERLECAGIPVVSANTDGIAIYCRKTLIAEMDAIIAQWEKDTQFDTELTEYRSLHKHSVNSYIAIKTDGKFTLKGEYTLEDLCPSKDRGIATNPANQVSIEAAALFLRDLKPIEQTIRECRDVRRFVTIRQVNGGAIDQQGAYLGKAVRWYYARGVEGPLRYKLNNYTVARSEGARALMELPEALPDDIDHDWYCREALSILADVGVDPVSYQVRDLV